jgi:dolichol-phosphate mannosyltransferase
MPAYREGAAITPILRDLATAVFGPREIIVVVDALDDPTVPAVEGLRTEIAGLRVELNAGGRGVLQAILTGFARSTGRVVVVTMADGSDDYSALPRMIELVASGTDVVAASRYMDGGRQIGGPRLKRFMSRSAGLTLCWFAGVGTHDATNNFKAYSRRLLDTIRIESSAGFELALELTVKATDAGLRVAEVPATWRDRTSGESNFRMRRWLPHYLRWYAYAFRSRLRRLKGRRR